MLAKAVSISGIQKARNDLFDVYKEMSQISNNLDKDDLGKCCVFRLNWIIDQVKDFIDDLAPLLATVELEKKHSERQNNVRT